MTEDGEDRSGVDRTTQRGVKHHVGRGGKRATAVCTLKGYGGWAYIGKIATSCIREGRILQYYRTHYNN